MSKKNRNLKYQFKYVIEKNFKEGVDKHSDKKNGIRNTGRIYSYSDRKNLIDLSANFSNFMKENYPNVKLLKDIESHQVQEFLNQKAQNCSTETLKNYVSRFQKLSKQINNTYNVKVSFSDVVAPAGRNQSNKIRNSSMSKLDFQKLENSYRDEFDTGRIAINLASRTGLRVSEISKLKGSDIDLNKKIVHVADSKGKKTRNVPIQNKDLEYFSSLKEAIGIGRVCPVQSESILKSVNRHMKAAGIKENYENSAIHCIRKMYAQEEFDNYRTSGDGINEAWSKVSVQLGHGPNRTELMKTYIKNIH